MSLGLLGEEMAVRRCRDEGTRLDAFGTHFYVRCPRCNWRAVTRRTSDPRPAFRASVVCPSCGYAKDRSTNVLVIDGPRDWYFDLPLWLQVPCCRETLWAYNEEHLEFIEQYVGADPRERRLDPGRLTVNKSLASCLPRWIKSAKNRDEVLACLGRIRRLL